MVERGCHALVVEQTHIRRGGRVMAGSTVGSSGKQWLFCVYLASSRHGPESRMAGNRRTDNPLYPAERSVSNRLAEVDARQGLADISDQQPAVILKVIKPN